MAKPNSMLDTIAKTVSEVSKAYHDMNPDDDQGEQETEQTNTEKSSGSFPFGTSFSDIVKFTSEVEVFTRHIDSFTRERFRKKDAVRNSNTSSEAEKGDKQK